MRSLDRGAFNQDIKKRIESVIKDYHLIDKEDRIAVALSGGKDSVLTLYALQELKNKLDFELLAISVDEGIGGYREDGLRLAREHSLKLGIEIVEVSLKDEMSLTLDQAAKFYQTACVPCGVFRRYLLNRAAHKLSADKLATGHNLDDEVQSFLMSFARADTRRFNKFGPKLDRIHPKMVPRIKPLWMILEKEVGIWAVLNDIEVHMAECPYAYTSFRSNLKNYLNGLEEKRPGTKRNILNSFQKTFRFERSEKTIKLYECERCGEPSSISLCKACEMKEKIEKELK
ncbi:MAG: TIGR00269 family protein [Methanobacteriales archaeon Met13]